MCDQTLTITQREIQPDWLILDLCGKINAAFKDMLEEYTHRVRASRAHHVVLNFSGVDGLDSSGLKLLLIFCTMLRQMNRSLSCYGMHDDVLGVFRLARLDSLLQVLSGEVLSLVRGA